MAATVKYRFRCRRRTAADWVSTNEILLAQEIGLESDTGLGKVGDGVTAWNSLLYTIVGKVDLTGLANGKCLVWDSTNSKWIVANREYVLTAGLGMAIDRTTPTAPVINSTVAALALKGRLANYAALPSVGNTAGDAYILDTDQLVYIWNSTAWPTSGNGISLIGGGAMVVKLADQSRASNTTLSNDSELILPLLANTVYEIEVFMYVTMASATPKFKGGYNYTGTISWHLTDLYLLNAGSSAPFTGVSDNGTGTANILTPGSYPVGTGLAVQRARFKTGTAGNITVQWAQQVSNVSPAVLRQGSSLRARRCS